MYTYKMGGMNERKVYEIWAAGIRAWDRAHAFFDVSIVIKKTGQRKEEREL